MDRVRPWFTRRDYDLLPEGFPAQLVRGQLVREPPASYDHQQLAQALLRRLAALVGWRRTVMSPIGVGVDEHNFFEPDVVVLRTIPPGHARDVGIPLLAIEVLSPSTARRDRRHKAPALVAAGCAEVWLVDPATRTVEVHDASGIRTASGDQRLTSNAVPLFDLTPSSLFAPPDE
jgi:Uma2 family endonuclease